MLTAAPFAYTHYAVEYLREAQTHVQRGRPMKQAVISASAMSLLYPADGLAGYSRDAFLDDVVACAVRDIRECLDAGAALVQIDFTEGRLSLKLDPSGGLLAQMLALNERVIQSFSELERLKIGIHVCPGADRDSCHSADVPLTGLLAPLLSQLSCHSFYIAFAGEADKEGILTCIKANLRRGQRIFLGVTDVNRADVETPEAICDLITEMVKFIPLAQLGTCDDCGFSPFADDESTSRTIAFAKIAARLDGTQLARERFAALKSFFAKLLE